ncbi:hypothetical protein B0A49_04151 [Cryomyces minteri]|uniref:Major facilitator superfamily (MFS) profile domain-containing protein n=1 Tax=Cryomyces minteri TaxID=331657 RepID=A0A4U0XBV3_9PEZI|nr:hypothetical protein B0A49_04151 [Cryomyces minteri]
MSAYTFAAFLDSPSEDTRIADLPPVLPKDRHSISTPNDIELGTIWGDRCNESGGASLPQGAQTPGRTPHGAQTPKTPNELEMSRPPSPKRDEAANLVQSWSNPPMNKWRVLSACLVYFGNGMTDSATGAVIPYMEKDYDIGYAIVSLIFVTNAAGFILSAFFTESVLQRLGRAKTLMASELVLSLGFTMIVCTPPFGVVVTAYLFLGIGAAFNLALNNVFCANLARSTVILGIAHGSYGVGGIFGPIIATALVSKGVLWSRYYLVTLGIRLVCLPFVGWAFWRYEKEAPVQLMSALERTASRRAAVEAGEPTNVQLLKQALGNRVTVFGALLIFAYQGAEVSISGWVISFLINYRGGDPAKVGYVTAGFWAGITLGRFTLSHAAHRVGEKLFVYLLIAGAMAFQLLAWLIPNVIGDAVAVSILGLLLGPIYPCAQTIFTRLLPRRIQMTSISFISSAGSSGGAVAPFTTGLLAQAVGTFVLHPICIGLFVVMQCCWFGLPRVRKRTE